MRRRLLQTPKNKYNYIKIKINVTSTTAKTQIISSDFSGSNQIDHITFNTPDQTTKYEFSTTFQFTWAGERIGYIHFKEGVTSLEYLFSNITCITEVDLNELDTSKVTSMSSMCAGCTSLIQCLMSECRADSLLTMVNTFNSCSVLKWTDFGSYIHGKFKPKKLTDIRNMYNWCRSITTINMSMFDFSSVLLWGYTWGNCFALTEIYISSPINPNATYSTNMFINSTASGAKIFYNPDHDYSKIIAVKGSNWTMVPYNY